MCFSVLHQLVQLSQQEEVQQRHQRRPQIEAEASEATKTEMV